MESNNKNKKASMGADCSQKSLGGSDCMLQTDNYQEFGCTGNYQFLQQDYL